MKVLLDTHVLLWWVTADRRLTAATRDRIASTDNHILVSAASFWEIAIKVALRRVTVNVRDLLATVAADGFEELPVRSSHTLHLVELSPIHSDPFDRLLIAQAIAESCPLLTRDDQILRYADVPGLELLEA